MATNSNHKTSAKTTAKPTAKKTAKPTAKPTAKLTAKPTAKPTAKTTAKTTAKKAAKTTAKTTAKKATKTTAKKAAKNATKKKVTKKKATKKTTAEQSAVEMPAGEAVAVETGASAIAATKTSASRRNAPRQTETRQTAATQAITSTPATAGPPATAEAAAATIEPRLVEAPPAITPQIGPASRVVVADPRLMTPTSAEVEAEPMPAGLESVCAEPIDDLPAFLDADVEVGEFHVPHEILVSGIADVIDVPAMDTPAPSRSQSNAGQDPDRIGSRTTPAQPLEPATSDTSGWPFGATFGATFGSTTDDATTGDTDTTTGPRHRPSHQSATATAAVCETPSVAIEDAIVGDESWSPSGDLATRGDTASLEAMMVVEAVAMPHQDCETDPASRPWQPRFQVLHPARDVARIDTTAPTTADRQPGGVLQRWWARLRHLLDLPA